MCVKKGVLEKDSEDYQSVATSNDWKQDLGRRGPESAVGNWTDRK